MRWARASPYAQKNYFFRKNRALPYLYVAKLNLHRYRALDRSMLAAQLFLYLNFCIKSQNSSS